MIWCQCFLFSSKVPSRGAVLSVMELGVRQTNAAQSYKCLRIGQGVPMNEGSCITASSVTAYSWTQAPSHLALACCCGDCAVESQPLFCACLRGAMMKRQNWVQSEPYLQLPDHP